MIFTDEEMMIRKWQKLIDKGKLFETVEFNTQAKMMQCYDKLKADSERKARTWTLTIGNDVLGYYVLYLPNWRRVKYVEGN